ncbi:hypothetical protein SESBI_01089 [Sesbania bispinosa]|nr:hypothetical protein SESBI_01089 [Sesbania bispinosa]
MDLRICVVADRSGGSVVARTAAGDCLTVRGGGMGYARWRTVAGVYDGGRWVTMTRDCNKHFGYW